MKINRCYSQAGTDPLAGIKLQSIYNEDGLEFFVPEHLSEVAQEVMLEKIFFKGKIPAKLEPVAEEDIPEFLYKAKAANFDYEYENSYIQLLKRICGSITYYIYKSGLFEGEDSAKIFYDELAYILANNIVLFDLDYFATLGIDWAYGLKSEFTLNNKVSEFDSSQNQAFKQLIAKAYNIDIKEAGREVITFPIESADAENLINWKQSEEIDCATLKNGKSIIENAMHMVMDACDRDSLFGFDPSRNRNLAEVIENLRQLGIGDEFINLAIHYAEQGYEEVDLNKQEESRILSDNIRSYISLNDNFIESSLTANSYIQNNGAHISASNRLDNIASAIWASGEPSLIFRDKINNTNPTCKNLELAQDEAYLFVKGKSAPGASINLIKFLSDDLLDIEGLEHVVKILTIALDVLVEDNEYRAISIGYTNLAELLLANAIAYDSDKGRAVAASISSLITSTAFKTSVELVDKLGACGSYIECEKRFLQILKSHKELLAGNSFYDRDLDFKIIKDSKLYKTARLAINDLYSECKTQGLRNLYVTSIACSTEQQILLGGNSINIKPLHNLIISKDDGFFSNKVNSNVIRALNVLDYSEEKSENICLHLIEGEELINSPDIKPEHLEIFDCLTGIRKLEAMAQIKMQSAIDKFISGTIINIIELNHHATIDDVKEIIIKAWEAGVKKISLYRDRCSLLAPALIDITIPNSAITEQAVHLRDSEEDEISEEV